MKTELAYDLIIGDMRTVKINMGTYYEAVITRPKDPNQTTIQIYGSGLFAPNLQKSEAGISIIYPHTVVFPEYIPEFEKTFREAVYIAQNEQPFLDEILRRVRNNEPVAPLPEKD